MTSVTGMENRMFIKNMCICMKPGAAALRLARFSRAYPSEEEENIPGA